MYRDTIRFNKYDLPESFTITLSDIVYIFTIDYNHINDRFYLTISDENGVDLIANERLVIDEPLFASVNDVNLPIENLVPMDETGHELEVNFGNANDECFITIDDTFPGEMDPRNMDDGIFNPDGDDANMDFDADETDLPEDDDITGLDDDSDIIRGEY